MNAFLFFILKLFRCNLGCNYASSICGAFLLYNSDSLERADAILKPNTEHYAIGDCRPTYLIIKLCNEVKIKTIELQNREFLSSFPKQIKFYCFVKNDWIGLGTFDCQFTRKKQKFEIKTNVYTKVLRIDILSFIGKHSIFTLTSLSVYGKTIIDQWKLTDLNLPTRITNVNREIFHSIKGSTDDFETLMKNLLFIDKIVKKSKAYFAIIFCGFITMVLFFILRKKFTFY